MSWYNESLQIQASSMAAQLITKTWLACKMFSSVMILDWWVDCRRPWSVHKELNRKQSLLLLDSQASYWIKLHVLHAHLVLKIHCCATLETWYSYCCVAGDIIPYPIDDPYSCNLNKGEHLSKLLLFHFEYISKIGGIYTRKVYFSQPEYMGQWCCGTPQFATHSGI